MSGTNAGTGSPLSFRCANCRRRDDWRNPSRVGYKVRLTGRSKPKRRKSARHTNVYLEYECADCGYIGWSSHVDLMLPRTQAKSKGAR